MAWENREPATWARLILNELTDRGLDADAALRVAGLRRRDINMRDGQIAADKSDMLFEIAASMIGDDCFGARFGADVDPREIGLLTYVGYSSRTLGEAIHNLNRYLRVFTDRTNIEITTQDDLAQIEVKLTDIDGYFARQANESGLSFLLAIYRRLATRTITPVQVSFRHARQKPFNEIERIFNCPVHFSSEQYGMVMKREDFDIPLITADDQLLEILRGYCVEIISRYSDDDRPIMHDIRSHIVELLPKGTATLKVLAANFGMSERTFSRRLTESGTSFAALRDRLRCDLANKYLADQSLSMTQIAFLLGYSETSAFNHAYKRWTGHAPRERRNALG